MRKRHRPIKLNRLILFCFLVFNSCISTKKATYFNDLGDPASFPSIAVPQSRIDKSDILSITVSSLNPEATAVFNTPNSGVEGPVQGYLVGNGGEIVFPLLGKITVQGLTKDELKNVITEGLIENKLLLDPIVTVRLINFKVTVLGEVNKPAAIPVPNEKISLLEAIGLAGDLTIYAKRDNVLVIREDGGKTVAKRIDLNSLDLFASPYYYLQPNDIVYVEPNKSRVATSTRTFQLLPVIFSALSVTAIVLDRLLP